MTIPNLISGLRLLMVPGFIAATLLAEFEIAFAVFLFAALSDAVDGWLARRLNQTSRFGMVLDPAADKLMMVSGYLVYTLSSVVTTRLPVGLTFTVFARDVCLVLAAWLIYTRVRADRFPPSILGKVSTILQAVALGVTIAANTRLEPLAILFLTPSHLLALVITLVSGFGYIRQWEMFLDDPSLAERKGVVFVSS